MIEQRPWGTFEVLAQGDGYKIKRLVINPHQATSLQYHEHRQEYWVFVTGPRRGEMKFIPAGMKHRLENGDDEPMIVIEVQTGDVLDEGDIVRLEDRYGRV